jgi:decaprenylphospho-beta-D-ribofuranose 2-oxidase
MNTKKLGINFGILLMVIVLFAKFAVWDNETNRWVISDAVTKPDKSYKATVASPIVFPTSMVQNTAWINDASKLNTVLSSDFVSVKVKQDILDAVTKAKKENKKISISGARHSMGGQNLGSQIHLDMNNYDKVITFENVGNSVTVESGITWKLLQEFLITKNRAVRVMQDSNIFTIGGSIGSNVHGKDIRYGSLIESINWFKIVDSSGIETLVDRNNKELFESVVGGFGLFGIITEVNLKTEPNTNYKYTITHQPAESLIPKFDEYQSLGAEQIEGHFSVSKDALLQDLQIYYFQPTDKVSTDDVSGENSIWLRKLVYRLSRDSDIGKQFRWFMQTKVSPIVDPSYTTRNGSQAAPFRVLELNDPITTDVLQEYFVPSRKIDEFLPKYRELLRKNNMNLINCGVRKVLADKEALVSYATEEMYGFVCYYNVKKDNNLNSDFRIFTGEMLDYMNTIDAKYYLAYNFMDYNEKIITMYPNIKELLNRKAKYDPQAIFWNQWIEKFNN